MSARNLQSRSQVAAGCEGVGWVLPRYGHGGADDLTLELDGGQLTIGQPGLHLVELLSSQSLVNVADS